MTDTAAGHSPGTLTIIIPAYNEEAGIATVLERVSRVELPYGTKKQVIVVDDGSGDATYARASEWIKAHEGFPCMLLRHEVNHGKGRAIRTALEKATGDYIIIQDGDMELDPSDIAMLLRSMIDGGYDAVYGSRYLGCGNSHLSRSFYLGGRLVSHIANILYGQHITDEPTCYKLIRSSVMSRIRLRCERFEFCPEVTAKVSKLGVKIHEEPIHYHPRTLSEGKKLRWKDGVEAVWTLLKYRFTN